MTAFDRPNPSPSEPLPAEFDRQLIVIDRLLAEHARGESRSVPLGLSQRIFDASIAQLHASARDGEREPAPLRLVGIGIGAGASSVRRWTWSSSWMWNRLAMAASVALVGGIGLWVMLNRPAPSVNDHDPLVKGGAPAEPAVRQASLDFSDLNRLADDIGLFESEVAYLLEATQLRSVDELNDELNMFALQLEM